MKEKIIVGMVGVGRRGKSMLERALAKMNDIEIKTVCELIPERAQTAVEILKAAGRKTPGITSDYKEILDDPEIDAVFFFNGWDGRAKMAAESVRALKYTAVEVGCADDLEECFDLVRAYEETGIPVMMLENICYGKRELMALNMIKQGLFGEVVHCAGGYCHNLNDQELFVEMTREPKSDKITHYRLAHYANDNCENYPTHELGPICKCLGINRGNRMVSLSSFASRSAGLKKFAADTFGADSEYATLDYKQGDIVNTIITCAGGETILLTLDTTLPRPFYSRQFTIRGTLGMCYEDGKVVFLRGMSEPARDNEAEMFGKYGHPLTKEVVRFETDKTRIKEKFGVHSDGVDWMIFRAFIDAVKNGTNTPIDAYDTAAWMAVGPLSRRSIEKGGAPVEFPDFTSGRWQHREPPVRSKYCLDEIIVDERVGLYDSLD